MQYLKRERDKEECQGENKPWNPTLDQGVWQKGKRGEVARGAEEAPVVNPEIGQEIGKWGRNEPRKQD